MPSISNFQILKFKKQRKTSLDATLCYAPSISMNFDQSGKVTACCFNREYVLGKYPEQTVDEIWNGEKIQELRKLLSKNDLTKGCQQCELYIQAENFDGVLIRHFDDHAALSSVWEGKPKFWSVFSSSQKKVDANLSPIMLEFEISNHCNLECIMCGGNWSSAIRKNREKLPIIQHSYDDRFVEEIRQFLPQLKRANFLGGEPFLVNIYYEIWQSIIDVNPLIEVAITSNGTVLHPKAKRIIEQLPRCSITLSIDSLNKSTWENIRRNGSFEILEKNLKWLLEKKKLKSFSVCPMIQNRYEIPDIIEFCAQNNLDIFFNVVNGPLGGKIPGIHFSLEGQSDEILPEVSLKELNLVEMDKLLNFYTGFKFKGKYQIQLNHLIHQIKFWRHHKLENA